MSTMCESGCYNTYACKTYSGIFTELFCGPVTPLINNVNKLEAIERQAACHVAIYLTLYITLMQVRFYNYIITKPLASYIYS